MNGVMNHTTHFDDCGCLTKRFQEEIDNYRIAAETWKKEVLHRDRMWQDEHLRLDCLIEALRKDQGTVTANLIMEKARRIYQQSKKKNA